MDRVSNKKVFEYAHKYLFWYLGLKIKVTHKRICYGLLRNLFNLCKPGLLINFKRLLLKITIIKITMILTIIQKYKN